MDPMMQGTRPSKSFVDWLMRYLQMTEQAGFSPEAMRLLEMMQSNRRQPLPQPPDYASILQAAQERAQQAPPMAPVANQSFLDYLRNDGMQSAQGRSDLFDFIANYIRQNYSTGARMIAGGASRMM